MDAVWEWMAGMAAAVSAGVAWANSGLGGKVAERATAAATSIGATIAYVSLRRSGRRLRESEDPVSEAIMRRGDRLISLSLTLENRTGRSLTVRQLRVLRPRGGRISGIVEQRKADDPMWRFDSDRIDTEWIVTAAGASSGHPLDRGRGDRSHRWLSIEPPASWPGGKVVVELTAEESAATSRSRRITIRRRV